MHQASYSSVASFLRCKTPEAWLQAAPHHLEELLIDHANCEKKAASTALNLIYRYVDRHTLMMQLSKLAREELRHFEQVASVLHERGIRYEHLPAARYAAGLRAEVRTHDPARLVDLLVVGAIVEARSCERFIALTDVLEGSLAAFYGGLAESEARHFEVYLALAESVAKEQPGTDLQERIDTFLQLDAALVTGADEVFRFHSGPPAVASFAA